MQRRYDLAWALVAAAALVALAIARAWLCDDAFITFRVVDQLLAGNGPVYNAGERVQVFTHPLWFWLLAAWSALGGSLHPGAMFVSLALFAAGVAALVLAFRDRPLVLAFVLVTLLLSRAAVDYATSGLETPVSFALAAAAVLGLRSRNRALAVAALALLPFNRLDLALWALPFAFAVPAAGWRGRMGVLALWAIPAAAWAGFSMLYYGSPVPNTALAKLSGETDARIDQGLSYLAASLVTDPGTLVLVVAGLALGSLRWRDDALVRASFAALLVSLAYVVWAGGDFMVGRFLLPAIWAAAVVIAAAAPARRALGAFAALLVAAHLAYGDWTLRTRVGVVPGPNYAGPYMNGALDERRFYLPWLGLFPARDLREMDFVRQPRTPTEPPIVFNLGLRGRSMALREPLIDWYGLADPLLARIQPFAGARPGHANRPMPEEFWRWREPAHAFADARMDALARDLRLAHRSSDLFSAQRLAAIGRLVRERRVPVRAVDLRRDGDSVFIAVVPARMDLRVPIPGKPVVWSNRDCAAAARPLRDGYLVLAGADGTAHLRGPARDFDRIPFLVSAGAIESSGEPTFIGAGAWIVRDRFAWVKEVPRWAVSGHE
jgi:arabinofuranosyltransferase